jgi:transcriptional regulator with XRE-family HTH domain
VLARNVGLEQIDLARSAGIDPSTLSRMENCGGEPVRATSKNLEAVLNALRRVGVEIEDDGLRLLKRRGR